MGVTSERVTRTAAEGVPAVPRPLLHSVELALFQALTTAASVLPERLALAAGASLGWIAGSVLRIRRRAVESHLALAFPQRAVTWRRRVARPAGGRATVARDVDAVQAARVAAQHAYLPPTDDVPDAQRFIPRRRHRLPAIRRHAHAHHEFGMPSQHVKTLAGSWKKN